MARHRFLVFWLLALHTALLAWSGWRMAPTFDEPLHLTAGWYTWQSGRTDLYAVNPPLVKTVAAIPLFFLDPESDWSSLGDLPVRKEFDVAENFMAANAKRMRELTTASRWACLPFSLLGAWGCYLWGRRLYGPSAGLVALTLWSFSPTILGNGALITADVASAAMGIWAGYHFWRWLRSPEWGRAAICGVMFGICLLTKLTWLCLPAIWVTVWVVDRLFNTNAETRWGRELLQGAVAVFFGFVVLNLGYAFENTGQPLGEYQFESRLLNGISTAEYRLLGNRFEDHWLGEVPVPLPKPFVHGFDSQREDFESGRILYFAGQRNEQGWWYFHLAAILLKEPLGLWLLAVVAVLPWRSPDENESSARHTIAVILPALFLFVFISSQTRLNYYRYLTPVLPFLFVAISRVGVLATAETGKKRWGIVALLVSVMASGIGSVSHSLSYVNLAGRAIQPDYWWFSDANYDWGQDLYDLKAWRERHPQVKTLHLAYFGILHPEIAGVEFSAIPEEISNPLTRPDGYQIPPGWYAISVSHLNGIDYYTFKPEGRIQSIFDAGVSIFQDETPVDRAGRSILIYHIPENSQDNR
ncbi:MAG: glycosyltransferase family 39 protein [Planctomycetaceae bacterium]|nr:glycosyltransferase family 39 protein [Planctomycetaceae bacterium]